jgi:hypothetical protein
LDGTAVAEGLEKVDRLQVALLLESSDTGAEGSMGVGHEPKYKKRVRTDLHLKVIQSVARLLIQGFVSKTTIHPLDK